MDLVAPESVTVRAAAGPVSVRAAAGPATAPVGEGPAAAPAPVVAVTASARASARVRGTAPVPGTAPGREVVGARVTAAVRARAASAAPVPAAPVWVSAAPVAAGTAAARALAVPGVPAGAVAPVARRFRRLRRGRHTYPCDGPETLRRRYVGSLRVRRHHGFGRVGGRGRPAQVELHGVVVDGRPVGCDARFRDRRSRDPSRPEPGQRPRR